MPTPALTLHVASTNPGKLRDFATAALPHGITVVPLPGLASFPEPAEDAATFAGNAALKAIAYSRHAPGLLVLADDSGLEVDALGGRPGVLSARFADSLHFAPEAGLSKDERNNRCVLSLLTDLEAVSGKAPARTGRFVCALAVARDGAILHRAEGTVAGDLLHTPRGTNGFGYDSLFALRPPASNQAQTLAELTPDAKWAVSHRGQAFQALLRQLK